MTLEKGSGLRNIDRLEDRLVGCAGDFEICVEKDPHENPRCYLEEVADRLPQPPVIPIGANGAVGAGVHVGIGFLEDSRVREKEEAGIAAGRSVVADGIQEIVYGQVFERVGDNDQLELGTQNEVVKIWRGVDRVNAEISATQHRCDPFEAGLFGPDNQYVLPIVGHLSIITQDETVIWFVLGFPDLRIGCLDGVPGGRTAEWTTMNENSQVENDIMARGRPFVSGVITSFNEEHNIGDCIESLLWCDEIIVVDSFSTDRTPEIARSYEKVRFFQRNYFGAGAQKNWAMQHVTHEWIFLLDSDERCTPELRQEVEEMLAAGAKYDAYMLNRNVYLLGERIRFSGWQHDRVARLFRRGTAYYENRRVHSILHTKGETPILDHAIEHHMVDRSFDEYAFRLAKYGYWNSAQCWRDGVRTSALSVWVRPAWRFFRTYILQLGILDGARGIIFCLLQSYSTYMKFAILWGWQVNEARGITPTLPEFDEDESTWEGLKKIEQLEEGDD